MKRDTKERYGDTIDGVVEEDCELVAIGNRR